jgi:hypothetical protein
MSKKEKQYGFDVSKILTEDFDDDAISEKEERRLKWEERRKK